ncbi:MAG: polysaccharide biosynthesis C-terminal domain-containing protein, partial [Leptospiraceae bacterium]|nr:polysaccharide biosynthesis C-terminal domain-containing protein [Leptospiraceae bacterium]
IPGLRFAHRLIQLPTGIIGVALSTAILPTLVAAMKSDGSDDNGQELVSAMAFSLFLTVPAGLGLYLLGPYIIHLLFSGGKWTVDSTLTTWHALQFYCIGVPFYSLNRILTSSFYAYQDTKTPVRILMFTVAINLCLNLILIPFLEHGALALSTSTTSFLNCMALLYLLRKKIHRIPWNELGSRIKALMPLWLSLAATVCVMLLLLAHMDFWNLTDPSAIEASLRGRSMWMIVIGSIGAGSVVYLALALLLRNREIAVIRSLFR